MNTLAAFRKIEELDAQLGYERVKREKRESELDECRREIARLINELRAMEANKHHARVKLSIFCRYEYTIALFLSESTIE